MKRLTLPEQLARARIASALFTFGVGAALLWACLHKDSLSVFAKVLGSRPLGVDLRYVVGVLVVLLVIPLSLAAFHAFRIWLRGMSEGRKGSAGSLAALITIPNRYPDLKVSRTIVFGTFTAYLIAMIAWAVYADSRGL